MGIRYHDRFYDSFRCFIDYYCYFILSFRGITIKIFIFFIYLLTLNGCSVILLMLIKCLCKFAKIYLKGKMIHLDMCRERRLI